MKHEPIISESLRKTLRIYPMHSGAPKDAQALYRPSSGEIQLGSYEMTTPRTIWHEQMHKIFYEVFRDVPATYAFDNIAHDM